VGARGALAVQQRLPGSNGSNLPASLRPRTDAAPTRQTARSPVRALWRDAGGDATLIIQVGPMKGGHGRPDTALIVARCRGPGGLRRLLPARGVGSGTDGRGAANNNPDAVNYIYSLPHANAFSYADYHDGLTVASTHFPVSQSHHPSEQRSLRRRWTQGRPRSADARWGMPLRVPGRAGRCLLCPRVLGPGTSASFNASVLSIGARVTMAQASITARLTL
jgi:hypothetical protein